MDYAALAELLAAAEVAVAREAVAYEDELRAYFGAAAVYPVSSGRGAIALALQALGIGRGDDVAIPAFTCPAVADAVLSLGAIPHLVDISPRHFGLEARSLRRVLARGRTRAAVVTPLFGAVPLQDELQELLAERGVPWLEDIAQGFGSRRGGRPAGSAAPLAVISSNFDKPYTTGRGGVLVVNDAALVPTVEKLVDSLPAQTRSEAETILTGLVISDYLFDAESYESFTSVDLGYLYAAAEGDAYDLAALVAEGAAVAARHARAAKEKLMPDRKAPFRRRLSRWFFPSSAVPPLGPVKRLEPMLAAAGNRHLAAARADGSRRRKLAALFDEAFAGSSLVRGPNWGLPEDEPWPVRYPLFVRDWARRAEVVDRLAAAGYEAGPFIYPRPLSGRFPYYKISRTTGRYLRGAWRAAAALVNLPLHAGVDEDDVLKMAEAARG